MATVSFNTVTRIITITEVPVLVGGEYVVDLDVQYDLYSRGKDAWQSDETLRKLRFPIRAVGGDNTPDGVLGDSYFIAPDWKIAPYEQSHRLRVLGNFYSEDGTSPFNKTVGAYNLFLEQIVSTLVETPTSSLSAGDKQAIADDVWNRDIVTSSTPDSAAHVLSHTRFIERKVFVDPELVPVGDGTAGSPFNNIGDAIDLAELESIKTLVVFSEITLDRNLKNFKVVGVGVPVINCGGYDLKGSEFSRCTMKGNYVSSIIVQESVLADGFELNGFFENCGLAGDFVCQLGSTTLVKDCSNLVQNVTIDMNSGGASQINFTGYSGSIIIDNCDNVADVVHIGFIEGVATLNASNTLGSIIVGGVGKLIDNSAGSTVDGTGLTENLIWDKDISAYTTDGKAGYELQIARLKAALAAALSA